MSYCYTVDQIREGADVLQSYVDLENDLIKLAGFNLRSLIDKLKNGYTIEEPKEENLTPHLVDISDMDDWIYGHQVFEIGVGVEWDDLTDYEKRKIYESQHYRLYKKRKDETKKKKKKV